jgi:hypothetical protein
MIRVPFFTSSESRERHHSGSVSFGPESQPGSVAVRGDRMESRLEALEFRLISHAEELKCQIAERVLRIQSRIERALHPFEPISGSGPIEPIADNVLEFGKDGGVSNESVNHLLHASNAREAMLELNETLRVTREHLESLSSSIERMRASLAAR